MKDLADQTDTAMPAEPTRRCPLTGAPMQPHLHLGLDWRRPDDPRAWQIWRNAAGSFGQVLPRPAAAEVPAFYDLDAYYTHGSTRPPADEERRIGTAGRLIGALANRFERGAEPTPGWWRTILPPGAAEGLEIGCGNGDRMRTLQPFFRRLTGIEPDPRAVQAARAQGMEVFVGTAEVLPGAVLDRRYDAIVFAHVLEHTLDPVLALANARDLLAPGGVMSVEVPNNACEGARRMGPAWRWLDAPRHLNFFTPQSLQACAVAAGLRVRAVLFRGYVRQFMPDWLLDEARIRAALLRRPMTQADIDAQVRHSARLLAATALAAPGAKYDSVRVICTRD